MVTLLEQRVALEALKASLSDLSTVTRACGQYAEQGSTSAIVALLRCRDHVETLLTALADAEQREKREPFCWHPANDPPKETEWVIASSDGQVRCMAWNHADRRWENWDRVPMGPIEWWMSIPPLNK